MGYLQGDITQNWPSKKGSHCLEQKGALSKSRARKIFKKVAGTAEKTALKPIANGRLPDKAGLDMNHLPELPIDQPPLDLQFQSGKSLAIDLSELQCSQQLLTPASVDKFVVATNSEKEGPAPLSERLN